VGQISPSQWANQGYQTQSVRLIGGSELARLCATHRVGVWEEAAASADDPVARGVEHAFFRSLEAGRPDHESAVNVPSRVRVSVAVRVFGNPSRGQAGNWDDGESPAARPPR
jgi:hypothetical protein